MLFYAIFSVFSVCFIPVLDLMCCFMRTEDISSDTVQYALRSGTVFGSAFGTAAGFVSVTAPASVISRCGFMLFYVVLACLSFYITQNHIFRCGFVCSIPFCSDVLRSYQQLFRSLLLSVPMLSRSGTDSTHITL